MTQTCLSHKQRLLVAGTLFGMFFGAGNLIFPVHMGQMAGANVWPAVIGFCVTGVGLPLLGVAALGISRSYVSRIEKKALEKLRSGLEEGQS